MSTLTEVRDEILPLVLMAQTPQVSLTIFVEETHEALLIAGRNDRKNRELGFAISRATIVDGRYKEQIGPALQQLVTLLESPDLDDEDEIAARPRYH